MSDAVRYEVRSAVAVLTIDRESRMNSLSGEVLAGLGAGTKAALEDDGVRAIVVTSAGAKAFCAGADLKERQGMSAADIRSRVDAYRSELGPLDRSPKPVVAAINGVALGGGLELALLCDLRVCVSHAVLGLPETALAIIPGAGGTQRLPRVIGEARAKEMILLGRRLSAEEALVWGLVNRVVPDGADLLEETLSWIRPIAAGAPVAQAAALHAIDAAGDSPLEVGLGIETAQYETVLATEDRLEALRAFAEKRPAVFRGR